MLCRPPVSAFKGLEGLFTQRPLGDQMLHVYPIAIIVDILSGSRDVGMDSLERECACIHVCATLPLGLVPSPDKESEAVEILGEGSWFALVCPTAVRSERDFSTDFLLAASRHCGCQMFLHGVCTTAFPWELRFQGICMSRPACVGETCPGREFVLIHVLVGAVHTGRSFFCRDLDEWNRGENLNHHQSLKKK